MLPLAVSPTRFVPGIASISDQAPLLTVLPIEQALKDDWTTDAHLVTYRPDFFEPGHTWPRINKSALTSVRAQRADLVTNLLVFDFDCPEHKPWSSMDEWEAFLAKLYEVAVRWPVAGMVRWIYSSRGGARLIYTTRDPMPVDIAEEHHRWMVQQFLRFGMTKESGGVYVDEKCTDWTRLFRLPYVLRDGTYTRHDSFEANGFLPVQFLEYTSVLDNATLGKVSGNDRSQYGEIKPLNLDIPNYDEAVRLIWVSGTKDKLTDWAKRAKKKITGRECFDPIFNNVPLAQGERNNRIAQYVGQVVGILIDHGVEGTTPQHVYGLMLPVVDDLEPDASTPSWHEVLWDMIQRTWAKQAAKVSKRQEVKQAEEQVSGNLLERVITGMREWCFAPQIIDQTDNNANAVEWASQRFVLSVGNTYYVMGSSGYFDPTPLSSTQLVPHIRRTGMDAVISVDAVTEGGAMKERELKQILSDHATIVADVEVVASQTKGGTVARMDTPRATLQLPAFRRRHDLEPQFSPEVDMWLQMLFGDHYPLATKWIGWALAFEEGPICALSIKAEQGVGKKLLVQGLAECLEVPAVASAADLTSNYQYGLLQSPFLVVNEGFPRLSPDSSPYHVFRSLVSGDPQVVNRRYLHPVTVRCPFRVLFTANNDNIIEAMIGKGNLSPEDRQSLAIRLIHMDLGDKASHWLRARGGVAFTGRTHNRWIAGDSGEPSDFVIAKHFLWLYSRRVGPKGARFLVEGSADTDTDLMLRLRTQAGSSPLVIQTLIKMLNEQRIPRDMAIVDDRLYVLSAGVLDYFQRKMAMLTKENLTQPRVSSALRGLAMREERGEGITLKGHEDKPRARWIELDPEVLHTAATNAGYFCATLNDLVGRIHMRRLAAEAGEILSVPGQEPIKAPTPVVAELIKPKSKPKISINVVDRKSPNN